ncbi:MAG TPA: hypothetical protein VHO46_11795 [Bacteroidales bacterium]|nr:hypothetical protein [Bacteroidales bacterium]
MRKGLFCILFIISLVPVKAQEINITAAFDSAKIYAGDQIHFTVTVEQPSDIQIKIPSFTDTLIKNIEILQGPDVDSSKIGNNRIRVTEKYLVTSFDSGYYQLGPLFVEIKNPDGLKRFFSDYARLEVMKYRVAPADSTTNIYDIIGPYKAPVTLGEVIPWILAVLAIAAITWFLVYYIKKHKKQKANVQEIINPDPAHVIAFRELEQLKTEELWQNGHYKLYYTRLTEILRQYLENRYKVYSLELTTPETLNALLATGFKRDSEYERLKTVLTTADLVKFAKYVPGNEENELHYRNSWDFVNATKEVVILQANPVVEERKEGEK